MITENYPNKKIFRSFETCQFFNHTKHGEYTSFYKNGKIMFHGSYHHNLMNKTWIHKNHNQTTNNITIYNKGIKHGTQIIFTYENK